MGSTGCAPKVQLADALVAPSRSAPELGTGWTFLDWVQTISDLTAADLQEDLTSLLAIGCAPSRAQSHTHRHPQTLASQRLTVNRSRLHNYKYYRYSYCRRNLLISMISLRNLNAHIRISPVYNFVGTSNEMHRGWTIRRILSSTRLDPPG